MTSSTKSELKVQNTIKLLREIIKAPDLFVQDEVLKKALKTQTGLAEYKKETLNIKACVLNTFKAYVKESEFEFDFIDGKRKLAIKAIDKCINTEKPPKSDTKAGLMLLNSQLKTRVDAIERENFLLTTLVTELLSDLKKLAEHKGTIEDRLSLYRYANKKIMAKLTYARDSKQ